MTPKPNDIPKLASRPIRVGLQVIRTTLGLSTKLAERTAGEVVELVQHRAGAVANVVQHQADGVIDMLQSRLPFGPTTPHGDGAPDAADTPSPEASGSAVETPLETVTAPNAAAGPGLAPPEPPALEDYVAPNDLPDTPLTAEEADTKTIDDTDEVVAEFADPGAEDGAGAQLHLEEPWAGYADANTDEVIARIQDADTAELAVVELYEQVNMQRKMVLEAAERRLRDLAPPPAEEVDG